MKSAVTVDRPAAGPHEIAKRRTSHAPSRTAPSLLRRPRRPNRILDILDAALMQLMDELAVEHDMLPIIRQRHPGPVSTVSDQFLQAPR